MNKTRECWKKRMIMTRRFAQKAAVIAICIMTLSGCRIDSHLAQLSLFKESAQYTDNDEGKWTLMRMNLDGWFDASNICLLTLSYSSSANDVYGFSLSGVNQARRRAGGINVGFANMCWNNNPDRVFNTVLDGPHFITKTTDTSTLYGLQLALFMNYASQAHGMQTAVFNKALGGSLVMQLGVGNVVRDLASSLQLGFVNAAGATKFAFQTGFMNSTSTQRAALQLGILNNAENSNYDYESRTWQIGVINEATRNEAVIQIGLLNHPCGPNHFSIGLLNDNGSYWVPLISWDFTRKEDRYSPPKQKEHSDE